MNSYWKILKRLYSEFGVCYGDIICARNILDGIYDKYVKFKTLSLFYRQLKKYNA